MKKSIKILILFVFIVIVTKAQDITGEWFGIRNYPQRNTRITVHIYIDSSGYQANFDSPDNAFFDMPFDSVSFNENVLFLEYKPADLSFLGVADLENRKITGLYDQAAIHQQLILGRDSFPAQPGGEPYLNEQYEKQEVYIPMRDGVKLFSSIYTPKNKSALYPVLIQRTPYCAEFFEDKYYSLMTGIDHLVAEGYIFVFQDVRGRYMSEGEFVNVRPFIPDKKHKEADENSDTFDTIEWLLKNVENHNGKVGVHGLSYPGFYATMSLPNAHPAIKAVSPQAPVTEWFIGDDVHHNGAFFLMDNFDFIYSVDRPRTGLNRNWSPWFKYKNEDNYDFFMDIGPVKNVRELYFGDTIQFWPDIMNHPDYDDFWKARNPLQYLTDIEPAVLVVGGWFDAENLYGALETYKSIERQNQPNNNSLLLMGPWSHGQWKFDSGENLGNIHWGNNTSKVYRDTELKFFNYYLKDKGEMDLPEASIFITGSNVWQSFETWPPENVQERELFLHSNGLLSFTKPVNESSFDEYISDPAKPVPYTEDVHMQRTQEYLTDDQRFASRRPDVMVYETEILETDFTFVGPLNVNLFVSTTGTDADYVVKLIDVFADQLPDYPENEKDVPMGGYQMLVRGDVMRGRYRNSFENPESFISGKVTEVIFELPDIAHTFKKGHRIMIQVQNSWFPLVDRNPQQFVNIYECNEEDFIKATHRLYHDAQRPSHILVNVIRRSNVSSLIKATPQNSSNNLE